MVNNFDWVEIRTKDMKRAASFYENLFGWKIVEKEIIEGFDHWVFDTGDKALFPHHAGGIWLRPRGENLGILVYIAVDDIETTLKKVKKLGGKIAVSKTLVETPYVSGYKACFTDPDGNMLGLWESTNRE